MAEWQPEAIKILEARYLKKNKEGKVIEQPDEMLARVASHVAKAEGKNREEHWYDEFMSIMDTLEFLPNSPTLMNAGKELGQLSACFVLPILDDMSNIFEMVKQTALIHKTGGGTGLMFSHLRPANSMVATTSGVASGPVSFMSVFNQATEVIKQGGVRRGANIGILACSHPDIYRFIKCKEDGLQFQNFNISVSITDNFLKAVKSNNGYPLRNPYSKERTYIKANDLFDEICLQAWKTGEPGLLFIDTINNKNPIPECGRIEACNPCGEQPLLPYESCNLGSIDVSKFVSNNTVNWDRLSDVVAIAVRFLDDVIDVNKYPNVKIMRKTRLTRKVGLGIMGWADMLIKLGIRYDSDEAVKLAKRLMMNVRETAHMISRDLGKEKGYCFDRLKRRNSCLTTIAPTGTLSILAGCSSGIEPIFGKNYTKTVLNNVVLDLGSKYKVVRDEVLVTATEIPVEKHIEMQAAFQQYTDNAVSKTINLPNSATKEDVRKAFLLAHFLGCKGITVYRDGSRQNAPLQNSPEGELSECENGKCLI